MSIFRTYSSELNKEVLEQLTNGLTRKSILAYETYLGVLSEGLRLKVRLKYGSFKPTAATGIDIFIISTKCGSVDSYSIDFDLFWAGDAECRDYWLYECGWQGKEPTEIQMSDLAKEIEKIVSMYREDGY